MRREHAVRASAPHGLRARGELGRCAAGLEREWSARAGCRPSGHGEVVGPGWRAVAGPLGVSVGRADLGMGWKLGWVR